MKTGKVIFTAVDPDSDRVDLVAEDPGFLVLRATSSGEDQNTVLVLLKRCRREPAVRRDHRVVAGGAQ